MSITGRYKPYPAYKDSGVGWLGKIPSHWAVKRLKVISDVQLSNVDKKSFEGQDAVQLCNYTDVYYHEEITSRIEFMQATATPEQIRHFALRKNDVLITKDSESWTDIAVSSVVNEDIKGLVCGYHLALIRPKENCYGPYLSRAFNSIGPRDQFNIAANGITRFGLGGDAIKTGLFMVPPIPEQRAVAAFLDRESARIDELVAKNEGLIALLQEKRTALITSAVTKGLNPKVPMKDSGVEWLGEIPAHWEVKSLKRFAYLQAGTGITSETINEEGEFPVFGGNGIRGYTSSYTHEGEFPLIGRQGALCGCISYSEGKFWASEHAIVVAPYSKTISKWMFYLLTAMSLNNYSQSAAQPGLAVDTIKSLSAPLPKIIEQREIVEFLEYETKQINALVDKVFEAINRLKEYRTALISAAVTGRIDVRGEAA